MARNLTPSMNNWKTYKLGEIINHKKGFAFKSKDYCKIGTPIIRVSDLTENSVDLSQCHFINQDLAKACSDYELIKDDLIITTVGSWQYNPQSVVGKVVRVPQPAVGGLLNQNAVRLRAKESADQLFLYYRLKLDDFGDYLITGAQGSANQAAITLDQIFNFTFNLPAPKIRRRIAEILSVLDDKIELNRRMNQTLEQMAQTLFRQYFVDGIDEENLPEGWKLGKLGDVSKNIRKTVNPKELQEECKYIGLEHIPRKSIALTDWSTSVGVESQKYRFEGNHILFGKLRPYFHKVILAPFEGICSTDILVIKPLQDYMLAFCLLHYSSEEVVQYSNQLSHGTRMPRADWKGLSGYEIAIPPTELFINFNDLVSPTLQKIKFNIEEIQTLTTLRNTLLPKLMSGEIDVMQTQAADMHEPIFS